MDGLFQMIVYLLNVRVCATNGIIDFLVLNLPAGIGRTHWPMYVVAGLIEIVVMYFLFRFLIVKFNLKTPGREEVELCR
jgi:PTS system arbutin-like IIC component